MRSLAARLTNQGTDNAMPRVLLKADQSTKSCAWQGRLLRWRIARVRGWETVNYCSKRRQFSSPIPAGSPHLGKP